MIIEQNLRDLLVHENKNPYYIFSPQYSVQSAGIKVLHYLCHYLNLAGFPSFMVYKKFRPKYNLNPNIISPPLDINVINCHKYNNINPIVIYPDIAKKKYFGETTFFTYLLNYPGLLGGSSNFEDSENIFVYSKKIGQKSSKNFHVLFMPVINTQVFYEDKKIVRDNNLSYFYASKYRYFHKGEVLDITNKSIEITRNLPDSPTQKQIADCLRQSNFFATYEDTSLITESILCGCPVMLIKNNYFDGIPLAYHELGIEGCFSDTNIKNLEKNILKSKLEIPLAIEKYKASINNFNTDLENFINITQKEASKHEFPKNFAIENFLPFPQKEFYQIKKFIN